LKRKIYIRRLINLHKMKNLIAILTMASLVALGGCKKGEEDPFLSFSSRDSRLEGTWELTSGSMSITTLYRNQAPGSTASNTTIGTNTFDLNGTTAAYKYEETVNDVVQDEATYELPFVISMTFDKNGTYVSTFDGQRIGTNGTPKDVVQKSSGTWSWNNDGKNKAGITLEQGGAGNEKDFITGDFQLKKLSGSEMILVKNNSYSRQDITSQSIETYEDTEVAEMVMTKK